MVKGAGSSHGDRFSSGAARITEWPARASAAARLRTWIDAPLRPRTGMPRSGQRYRILMAVSRLLRLCPLQALLGQLHPQQVALHFLSPRAARSEANSATEATASSR